MGSIFAGALAYADDLTLLSPTPRAVRTLLSICEYYASEFNLLFNGTKSKCLFIAPPRYNAIPFGPNPDFTICGQAIEYVEEWPHLGHIISVHCEDEHDIINRRNRMCGQINNVLCFFDKRDPFVKIRLLTSYCYSLYGSVLWDLSHTCIDSVCCWRRKGVRRALNLPADASNKLLPGLCGTIPVLDELYRRTAAFIQRCLYSDCETVSAIANMSVFSRRMSPPLSRNACLCCSRFGIPLECIHKLNTSFIYNYAASHSELATKTSISVLRELIGVRSRQLEFSSEHFSFRDVVDMINYIARSP